MTSYFTTPATTTSSADVSGFTADASFSNRQSSGYWTIGVYGLSLPGEESWTVELDYGLASAGILSGPGPIPLSSLNVVSFGIMGTDYAAVTYVRDGIATVRICSGDNIGLAVASYTIAGVASIDTVYCDRSGNLVIKTTSTGDQSQFTTISSGFDAGEPPVINPDLLLEGAANVALVVNPNSLATDPNGDSLSVNAIMSPSDDVLLAYDGKGGLIAVWGGAQGGLLRAGQSGEVALGFSVTDGINSIEGTLRIRFSGMDDTRLTLSNDQALALYRAGYSPASFSSAYSAIVVADNAEAIQSRGAAPLLAYASLGLDEIAVTDGGAVTVDYETAIQLSDYDLRVTGASKLSIALSDHDVTSLMAIDAASPAALAQLIAEFASVGATAFNLADHSSLALSLATLSTLDSGEIQIDGAGQFALLDSAARIAGLTPSDIAMLADLGVTVVDVAGNSLSLSAGLVNKLAKSGLAFTAADDVQVGGSYAGIAALATSSAFDIGALNIDRFVLEDGARTIGSLTRAQIAQLGSAGAVTIDVVEDALALSAGQIAAFQQAGISFAEDDTITTRAAPAARADKATALEHQRAVINVLGNDGGSLPVTLSSASVTSGNGSVLVAADGRLIVDYTGADIDRGQKASVIVSYSIGDGIDSASAMLTVTFNGTNENGDLIRGTAKSERIAGTALDDVILGLAGADVITGLAGNDTITGGSGNDTISGGVGADMFIFSAKSGKDIITDFKHDLDHVDLAGVTAITDYKDIVAHHVVDHGSFIELVWGKGQGVTLKGISNIGQLDRCDFIFG